MELKITNNFLKIVLGVIFYLLFMSYAFGQDEYYPKGMGGSNEYNRNVNHTDGNKLQDLKRSGGVFYLVLEGQIKKVCSCNLVNNIKQDGNKYVSIAAHCLKHLDQDSMNNGYFSFDYEMAHATERGEKEKDLLISGIYIARYKILFKDPVSDLALLELMEYDKQLLDYAYATGWDNTIGFADGIWSNISHPRGDHKKVFINPNTSILKYFTFFIKEKETIVEGFMYKTGNRWHDQATTPQKGSSGSGEFSKQNLLKAVETRGAELVHGYSSAISNKWYGTSTESYFAKYLDPDDSWLNSMPGGYINDLVSTAGESFELIIGPNKTKSTPSIADGDPKTLHEDVLFVSPVNIFRPLDLSNDDRSLQIWLDILGIKAESFSNSDLLLSVYYLDKATQYGLHTESLLYGTRVDGNSEINTPIEFGFKKGELWDCDSPPNGRYPPCNRVLLPGYFYGNRTGKSTEIKNDYLQAVIHSNIGELVPLSKAKIPITVRLDNIGAEPIKVQAVSYPGDVPKNALQLFNPNKVWSKFKSYKYKPSRGTISEAFHINSIKVELEQDFLLPEATGCNSLKKRTLREITAGNNGGYLNLVNPNFQIKDIVASDAGCPKNKLIITINTVTDTKKHYGAWLDYHKERKEGGNMLPQNNYTYNFVDDITLHPKEHLATDSKTGRTIRIEHEVPFATDLPFDDSNQINTRLRVAIAAQPQLEETHLKQGGIYNQGEVEDYLVEIRPTSDEDKREAVRNTFYPIILMEGAEENDVCDSTDIGNGIDETVPEQYLPIHGDAVCGEFLDVMKTNIGKNAITFNGHMYMGVAEGGDLVHNASSKKTISIDFLKENITINQDEILYEEGGGQNGISIRLNGNKIEFGVKINGVLKHIESSREVKLNQMTNATAVFDEGELKLYINGKLEITSTPISFLNNTSIPEHLDDAGLGGTVGTTIWNSIINNFNGIVDYFAYWDDALTVSMIGVLATRIPSSNNNARGVTANSNTKPSKIVNAEKSREPVFSIAPNPAKEELNILVEVKEPGPVRIVLFDLSSKKVYEMTRPNISKGHQLISLRNLKIASGKYLMNIRAGNVKRSEKVIFE